MQRLEDLFTNDEILNYLAKKRSASAIDTASKKYFDHFGPPNKKSKIPEINQYFPSRKTWFNSKPKISKDNVKRLSLTTRLKLTIQYNSPWWLITKIDKIENYNIRRTLQSLVHLIYTKKNAAVICCLEMFGRFINSKEIASAFDFASIQKNLKKALDRKKISYWPIVSTCLNVQKRISDAKNGYKISFSPQFIPAPKDSTTFRLLCKFNSEDSLILAQVSRYLRSKADSIFSPNSYAFRCPPKKTKMPTHHDAIGRIHRFIIESAANEREVYVAECDIKKFFDSIPHTTIMTCLERLKLDLKDKDIPFDVNAIIVVIGFLESYTFPKARVVAHAKLLESKKTNQDEQVCFPWIDDDPIYKSAYDKDNIGVPQGSALSCFIANLVLHYADIEVEKILGKSGIYSRYCDDMIILTNDKSLCDNAFQVYMRELDILKLPYHIPRGVSYLTRGDKMAYWKSKSKLPYQLSATAIPWCGFVGYQISYDGKIRPRLSSFKKEILKQKEVADGIISRIKNSHQLRHSVSSIVMSANRRIIARASGKGDGFLLSTDLSSNMSWVGGFDLYRSPYGIKRWGRELDRSKVKILKSLAGRLHSMNGKSVENVSERIAKKKRKKGPYPGRKYSYARRSL